MRSATITYPQAKQVLRPRAGYVPLTSDTSDKLCTKKSEIDLKSGQYHTAVAGGSTSGLKINSSRAHHRATRYRGVVLTRSKCDC